MFGTRGSGTQPLFWWRSLHHECPIHCKDDSDESPTAFTRTLTVLYSITLLSLFSHIQITLLGRNKYLQSIIALAHDERRQGIRDAGRSLLGLLFGGDPALDFPEDDVMALDPVLEPTERKYLTLTWWLLHVGWRDVGERVRRAVEEVFEGFVHLRP